MYYPRKGQNINHANILRQGAKAWNEWRTEHPSVKPDLTSILSRDESGRQPNLRKAKLSGADLRKAKLSGADLSGADLTGANLTGANLTGANLSKSVLGVDFGGDVQDSPEVVLLYGFEDPPESEFSAIDLSGANLNMVNLTEITLSKADLSGADLSGADLSGADLSRVNLTGANLSGADLTHANLSRANLTGITLSEANLAGVDLSGVNLTGANLSGADLTHANLSRANLTGANLTRANLSGANLIDTRLGQATFTNAHLWETQRSGWSIKGLICEAIYWDREKEEKTTYGPGEFERLFADKTRIKLFYKDGISPLEIATLPALIKHLEEKHSGRSLRLKSINDDSGGAVVELVIEDSNSQSPKQIKRLEEEAQQTALHLREALNRMSELKGQVTAYEWTIKQLLSNQKGDTYHISGQAGAIGPGVQTHDSNFDQSIDNRSITVDHGGVAIGDHAKDNDITTTSHLTNPGETAD